MRVLDHIEYRPDTSPLSTVWEDEHLLIVDKPTNLLTTPGRGPEKQDCLYHRLLKSHPNARVVHRLDMATSGLVTFALSHEAQVGMGKLFEKRLVQKTYHALVSGRLEKTEGEIDLPLICDWENRPVQKVCHESGKPAQTRYTLIDYDVEEDCSRVQLMPLTGRSHQLRVHMQALGHPIMGDIFYHPNFSLKTPQANDSRLCLHAHKLEFTHPLTQETLAVISSLPF
ncbi:MAG: pseudouridine synthase [Cellvibrionaceae bacterium]